MTQGMTASYSSSDMAHRDDSTVLIKDKITASEALALLTEASCGSVVREGEVSTAALVLLAHTIVPASPNTSEKWQSKGRMR